MDLHLKHTAILSAPQTGTGELMSDVNSVLSIFLLTYRLLSLSGRQQVFLLFISLLLT